MATTQAVGAGSGFAWLGNTFGLIRRHPAPMLGAAGYILAVTFAVVIGISLLNLGVLWLTKGAPVAGIVAGMILWMPMMYVFAGLFVGYLRLVRKLDHGEAASATDVFDGLRDVAVNLRVFGLILLLMIATQLLLVGVIAILAPDFGRWYLDAVTSAGAVQATPPAGIPTGFIKIFPVMLVLTMTSYAVQGLAVAQVALQDRRIPGALGDGFMGVARNLLPLLAMVLGAIGVALVALLAFLLVVGVIALAAYLTTQWLYVLAVPVYLLMFVLSVAFSYGLGYQMWRDICGGGAPAPELAA